MRELKMLGYGAMILFSLAMLTLCAVRMVLIFEDIQRRREICIKKPDMCMEAEHGETEEAGEF